MNTVPNNYFIDRTTQVFGDLIVKEFSYYKKRRSYWLCLCKCGNERIVSNSDLKRRMKHCGCQNRRQLKKLLN